MRRVIEGTGPYETPRARLILTRSETIALCLFVFVAGLLSGAAIAQAKPHHHRYRQMIETIPILKASSGPTNAVAPFPKVYVLEQEVLPGPRPTSELPPWGQQWYLVGINTSCRWFQEGEKLLSGGLMRIRATLFINGMIVWRESQQVGTGEGAEAPALPSLMATFYTQFQNPIAIEQNSRVMLRFDTAYLTGVPSVIMESNVDWQGNLDVGSLLLQREK